MATADRSASAKELHDKALKLLALDHFATLGIARTASPDEVKKAFVEAAKSWHPDRVPPGHDELKPIFAKVFARLEVARATVGNPDSRARYVLELEKPQTAASASDLSSAEATLEFRKAEGLLKKNDTVQAEQHLRRALHLAPSNVEYQVLLAWLQAKPDTSLDRLRELVVELDRLIERAPKAERAYFFRGQLNKRLDRTTEAMADFARAAQLNPSNVDAVREVRIHKMRQERAAPNQTKNEGLSGTSDGGLGGFFQKLFKR